MTTSSTIPSMELTPCEAKVRNSNDVGWKYASLVDPNNLQKVKCMLCGKVMHGGIYRMKQHIGGITGNVSACPKSTKEDQSVCRNAINENKCKKKSKKDTDELLRSEVSVGSNETIDLDEMETSFGGMKEPNTFGPMVTIPEELPNKGKRKQEDMSNIFRNDRITLIKEYICRWAYECGIPFHAFEKDSFKMMLEAIGQCGPNALPPTRYEFEVTYLKKEVERTRGLLKRYEEEWKLNGCSIMMDAWTDRKRSIINLCVNSKLGTVFLSSKECSGDDHTSDVIFDYVESCIVEVGPENVVQVVTDNASDNTGAAKLLKEKRPSVFWTSCAAHTINLMLEAIGGLARYHKILEQAKKLTIFIYAHHKSLALMRQYTKKKDIVSPGITRFASTFLTLQSLAEKKYQLRQMFVSDEWDNCKLSKSVRGKTAYATVVTPTFWSGVTTCLKFFAPLVKVLRMVDADWKPSMGFLYGELKKAKEEIKKACNNNKKTYEPIIEIISSKMKDRLDTSLHMAAYILNPFYLYNNLEVQDDIDANGAVIKVVDTFFPGDYVVQNEILTNELPKYKGKLEKFGRMVAIKGCEVNDEKYDPANWWSIFGGSAPHLRKIAIKILSLTTTSSGCERIWSTFEGVHTRKRNRLETTKLKNLLFVHFNANLMERNKKRKSRDHDVLLANDASEAQDWLVDGGVDWETTNEAMGADKNLAPRRSARSRELYEDEFESESEEVDADDVEYESDGDQIIDQYGQNDDEA